MNYQWKSAYGRKLFRKMIKERGMNPEAAEELLEKLYNDKISCKTCMFLVRDTVECLKTGETITLEKIKQMEDCEHYKFINDQAALKLAPEYDYDIPLRKKSWNTQGE